MKGKQTNGSDAAMDVSSALVLHEMNCEWSMERKMKCWMSCEWMVGLQPQFNFITLREWKLNGTAKQVKRSDSFNSTAQSIQRVEIELMADWNELNTKRTKANEINPFQFNSEIEMKLDDWVAMLKKERIQSIHSFLSVKCNGVDESRAVYTSLIDSIALSFVFFKWNEMKCIEIKSIIL